MEIESLELKTEKEYKEFLDYLFSIRDLEYRDFNTKIVVPVDCEIIGIRTPILRDIAKKIAKTSSENFLNFFEKLFLKKKIKYYEEKVLYGFLIGYSKMEYQDRLKRIDFFVNIIDNWAVCDTISPKIFKKNKKELIEKIKEWSQSDKTYTCRFGVEMLMTHFLDEDFKKEYLEMVANIHSEEYYVKMVIAWFFATALAKQWDYAVIYLENNKLDVWVHNKTIQKARESLRILEDKKGYLKGLKRKKEGELI